jgi:hypothetical protein
MQNALFRFLEEKENVNRNHEKGRGKGGGGEECDEDEKGGNTSESLFIISDGLSLEGTAPVVQWSEFLATDSEVPASIPGATIFSEM